MKKQNVQIALTVAGIAVAVWIYLRNRKPALVPSPADKPGSPYYTATGASSPAGVAAAGQQQATQNLQNQRGTLAQLLGLSNQGQSPWGQAAGAVGGLLKGLFGKGGSSGGSGGNKLSSAGSNYKGPGSLSSSAPGTTGNTISESTREEFGEQGGQSMIADTGNEFSPNDPLTGQDWNYGPDNSASNDLGGELSGVDFSGGENNGEGSSDFSGYGGNDGIGLGDLALADQGGGDDNALFSPD